jgi:hypothetical protein
MHLCCPFVPFSEPQQVNSFSVKFFCESCTSGLLARLYHSKRCNILLDTRLVYLEIWFLNKAYKWDKRKFISPPLTERFGCKKTIFFWWSWTFPDSIVLKWGERSGFCNCMGMQSLGVCSVGVTKQNEMEAFCTWHQFSCSVRQSHSTDSAKSARSLIVAPLSHLKKGKSFWPTPSEPYLPRTSRIAPSLVPS